ncbi:MAG: MBL fold metallo-hydrolase [Myxococcota bacterium]|jgi:glyoxylase-like metal-dependent hydrolase (beta-lactamase superfamily II)
MEKIVQKTPPIPFPPPPALAQRTAPTGPARFVDTLCADVRVVTVPGRYSNTHIVESAGSLLMADVGSVQDVALAEPVVRWLGKPVSAVIPTHLHFDHMMGVDAASIRFGAEVVLGQSAHELVRSGRTSRPPIRKTLGHFFIPWVWQGLPWMAGEDFPGGFEYGFPWSRNRFSRMGAALKDGQEIPGFDGWVPLHTPGHTDECTSLFHQRSGFLICGDTIRNYEGGEWDPIVTDSPAYGRTMKMLAGLNVRAIFFGHGPVVTGEDLIAKISNKYGVDSLG